MLHENYRPPVKLKEPGRMQWLVNFLMSCAVQRQDGVL